MSVSGKCIVVALDSPVKSRPLSSDLALYRRWRTLDGVQGAKNILRRRRDDNRRKRRSNDPRVFFPVSCEVAVANSYLAKEKARQEYYFKKHPHLYKENERMQLDFDLDYDVDDDFDDDEEYIEVLDEVPEEEELEPDFDLDYDVDDDSDGDEEYIEILDEVPEEEELGPVENDHIVNEGHEEDLEPQLYDNFLEPPLFEDFRELDSFNDGAELEQGDPDHVLIPNKLN